MFTDMLRNGMQQSFQQVESPILNIASYCIYPPTAQCSCFMSYVRMLQYEQYEIRHFLEVLIFFRYANTTINPPKGLRHNIFHLKFLPATTPAVSIVRIGWITGHGSPPQPPSPSLSSPERSWPLSPCTDYSRYLIIHLDPPHSQQKAAVPRLTQLPPHCARLWKGVKQNKESPLKYVATGT